MKHKYFVLFVLLLVSSVFNYAFSENRMKKQTFSSQKKKTMTHQQAKPNVTFYSAMGKDIAQHYQLKGKQMNENAEVNAAGSTIIKSGNNSTNIVINNVYGQQTNVSIGQKGK